MNNIFVSLDDFKNKVICSSDYCFICLESRSVKDFNDEHILPKWILKYFKLFNKRINLPNNSQFTYGKYVIPCCADCNSSLSTEYENPISELLKQPFEVIIEQIRKDKKLLNKLYHWLSLIFIKTHIKTTLLNKFQNPNLGEGKIGDDIEWNYLHHIYLMSRVHYTNAVVNDDVYGSILILKAINDSSVDDFDYVDSSVSKCVLLKINDFCIISCFDDGKAGVSFLSGTVEQFKENLHPLQLREVLAHLSYINVNLAERPVFQSKYNAEHQIIEANYPSSSPQLIDREKQQFQIGDFLEVFAKSYFPKDKNSEILLREIKNGTRGYLFDSKGEFFNMSSKN